MVAERRVNPGRSPYMSVADVRADLEQAAEVYPAAMELLAAALAAMERAGSPVGVTCTEVPRTGGVSVGGRFPHGRDRLLTVAPIGDWEYNYPRTPDTHDRPSAQAPLSPAEIRAHLDPADEDAATLVTVLAVLYSLDAQMIVEAINPHWGEAIVRTPEGDRLTLRIAP